MKWFDITDKPLEISGLAVKEKHQFYRLPMDVIDTISPGVSGTARASSGGRVRFRTDSPFVKMQYIVKSLPLASSNLSILGQSCADCYVDGIFVGNPGNKPGGSTILEKEAPKEPRMQDVEIYLPTYNSLYSMEIGLADDAQVQAPRPYTYTDPIVFYGSSITQGAAAARPGLGYVARTARALDADFINLGFSGSAKGEEKLAQYIAGLKMTAFVMDYDHNAPTPEHLRATHRPFFEIIRSTQPNLPILLLSRPDYLKNGMADAIENSAARRDIVKETYEKALKNGDKHVAFIDGEAFFPMEFWDCCTADTCHPNDLGFHYMTLSVTAALKKLLAKS